MILVDTSVWVNHLRAGDRQLVGLLVAGEVGCHPFVIGELACGNLHNREEILRLLSDLPRLRVAEHGEVMRLIEARTLHGKGLGWIDTHLLASALLDGAPVWTLDRSLATAAQSLGIAL